MAKYEVVEVQEADNYVLLRDVGPWHLYMTITNSAEEVVQEVLAKYGNRKIYYIDSEGQTDQLKHDGEKFTGFAPGGPEQVRDA